MKLAIAFLLMASTASAQSLPAQVCSDLKAERAKYPASLTSICKTAGQPECPLGSILNTVAFKNNLRLAGKNSGYFVVSPAGNIASDILMREDKIGWDVFTDAENVAKVNCGSSIGAITNRPSVSPVNTNPPPATCEQKVKELQYLLDNARCVLVLPN